MDDETYVFGGYAQADAAAEEAAERAEEDQVTEGKLLLDAFDIAAINAARAVLQELAELQPPEYEGEGWRRDYHMRCLGHTQGMAETAEALLFQLLNYSKHHLDVGMTDDQLHNREPLSDSRTPGMHC